VIELQNLQIAYGKNVIIDRAHFVFPKRKISVLLGPSGCGKSTILQVLAGLKKPSAGLIKDNCKKISFVFQEPRLLPWLTIHENIFLPCKLQGHVDDRKIADGLAEVGLKDRGKLFPHQLSGGMKMRASIARALITEPELLLMDEPFAALDEVLRYQMQELLLKIQAQMQLTVVFVTHSFSEAVYLGDQLYVLAHRGGHIVREEIRDRTKALHSRQQPEDLALVESLAQTLAQQSSLEAET